jgi:hypothetical protein
MTNAITNNRPGNWALTFDSRVDLSLALTLLLLLLYSHHYWYIQIPLSVIALTGLIFPHLRTSPSLWAVAAFIVAIGTYTNWYTVDKHKYLLAYWCVAILCALLTRDPDQTMQKTAGCLIGLVFVLALLQKTISDNYLNSTFFYYELLLDERFSGLAKYVGGISDQINALNIAARRALVNYDSMLTEARLGGTENAAKLAVFITWWNYLIQVIIGIAFLAPRFTWLWRTRDVWLLVFLFTTYLFAPVIGFGWVLAIMGIAQTEIGCTKLRALYVTAFLFLQFSRVPWGEFSGLLLKLNPA